MGFAQIRKKCKSERKLKIKLIESSKNKHICELMKKHKQSLNDIKNYYSDIIHSNLDLIKALKCETLEVQKKEKSKEQDILAATQVNIDMLQGEYDDLEWKHEILRQKHDQESEEYDVLVRKYESAMLDIKQKKSMKTLILNRSIKQVNAELEKHDINFN